MFVFGERNRALSYLPTLADHRVELAEIPHSGHWPRYSNAPEMWSRIAEFLIRVGVHDAQRSAGP